MADTYGRKAALRPADTNEAELYACPASTEFIGKLFICNQNTSTQTIGVAITDAAGAATGEDWIKSGESVDANSSVEILGIVLAASETIRVIADIADKVSFVLVGLEIS